jgi:hypothetical protein
VQELFMSGLNQGTTHLCQGQEAVPVGAISAMRGDDYLTITYRGHGHALMRGVPMEACFAELMGRSTGRVSSHGWRSRACSWRRHRGSSGSATTFSSRTARHSRMRSFRALTPSRAPVERLSAGSIGAVSASLDRIVESLRELGLSLYETRLYLGLLTGVRQTATS